MGPSARPLVLGCAATVALVAGLTLPAAPAKPPKVLVLGTPAPPPAGSAPAAPPDDPAAAGVVVAQAALVESVVEVRAPEGDWTRLPEGGRVRTGDRLRTDANSVARVEFPWMSVALGPSSELTVGAGRVLGLRLEAGRVELASGRDDIVKLDTAEARVRGRGQVVVRREGTSTHVSLWHGEARVSSRRGTAELGAGFGCRVDGRGVCRPAALPPAPVAPRPGSDPVYVAAGQPLTLAWTGDAPAYQVQVLSFDEEVVLAQRGVSRPSLDIAVPWPGLYRFRASARGADGLESRPSLEGLFQVMPDRWMKSGTDGAAQP
jgi:hypothetical protein